MLFLSAYAYLSSKMLTPICGDLKGYTHKKIIAMYQDHKKEIDDIRKLLFSKRSKAWCNSKLEGTFFYYSDSAKKYFSPEDWAKIQHLFIDTTPYSIRRYGNPAIQICYVNENAEPLDDFCFYYIPNGPDSGEYSYHKQKHKYFDKLGDNWFLGYGYSQIFK